MYYAASPSFSGLWRIRRWWKPSQTSKKYTKEGSTRDVSEFNRTLANCITTQVIYTHGGEYNTLSQCTVNLSSWAVRNKVQTVLMTQKTQWDQNWYITKIREPPIAQAGSGEISDGGVTDVHVPKCPDWIATGWLTELNCYSRERLEGGGTAGAAFDYSARYQSPDLEYLVTLVWSGGLRCVHSPGTQTASYLRIYKQVSQAIPHHSFNPPPLAARWYWTSPMTRVSPFLRLQSYGQYKIFLANSLHWWDAALDPPKDLIYNPGDIAWVLASTALVWIMVPGVGFFYSGLLRCAFWNCLFWKFR